MGVIQEFFNNREIAIGIWVIIGLAVILPTNYKNCYSNFVLQEICDILHCISQLFGFGVVRIKLGRNLGSHFVKRHCLLGIVC